MQRYAVIDNKNQREIVLLIGRGCIWKKCTFCDYHLDCSDNLEENFVTNKKALDKVTGIYQKLEVINSGSFAELDSKTMEYILQICLDKHIETVHFECHYLLRKAVAGAKKLFSDNGITLKMKTGVETFDIDYRENIMKKGFGNASPQEIAEYADEVCLLFGLEGQTEKSMENDITTGLQYFDRVCVNIMTPNTTNILPDQNVIDTFLHHIAPRYIDNDRVDILMENTDFGVGSPDSVEEDF